MNSSAREVSLLEQVIANLDVNKEEEDVKSIVMEEEDVHSSPFQPNPPQQDQACTLQQQLPATQENIHSSPLQPQLLQQEQACTPQQYYVFVSPNKPPASAVPPLEKDITANNDEDGEEDNNEDEISNFSIPPVKVAKQRLIKAKKDRLSGNVRECVEEILHGLTFEETTKCYSDYKKETILRVSRAFRKLGYKTKPFCSDPDIDAWNLIVTLGEESDIPDIPDFIYI